MALTRDMLAPVHPTPALPRAASATSARHAREQGQELADALLRVESALLAGDYPLASRLATECQRRVHDLTGFVASSAAYARQLERSAR